MPFDTSQLAYKRFRRFARERSDSLVAPPGL